MVNVFGDVWAGAFGDVWLGDTYIPKGEEVYVTLQAVDFSPLRGVYHSVLTTHAFQMAPETTTFQSRALRDVHDSETVT